MRVKLLDWQQEVVKDDHRFKVICAGRRAGKSVLARMEILNWASQDPGLYWIVAPTRVQAKKVHWPELKKEVPQSWIESKNESELSIELTNGSLIALQGADYPDSLRGVKLKGLVIDEIASIRNWNWLWQEVLRATLSDYEAPAYFISTPKGFNHFYDLYERGRESDSQYKSWKFTTYDNPRIPKGEIEEAKRDLTEDTFHQEYMADFRKYTGLVYKQFQRDIHVIEPFQIPGNWRIYRGFDFGSTNPTVCLWIAVDPDDNFYIADEYYKAGETIDHHAGVINANPLSRRVEASYGDPSGAQWITEFEDRGIYITPATKETNTSQNDWVRLGIEKVAEKLKIKSGHSIIHDEVNNRKEGMPAMFVFNKCEETIKEFEKYRWKENSVNQDEDLNEPDKPEKAFDHAMDSIRYFTVSYDGPIGIEYVPSKVEKKNWSLR